MNVRAAGELAGASQLESVGRRPAIAATLANGLDMAEAVREAQEYTWQALASGFRPGMGQLLPDRFFWAREVDAEREQGEP